MVFMDILITSENAFGLPGALRGKSLLLRISVICPDPVVSIIFGKAMRMPDLLWTNRTV